MCVIFWIVAQLVIPKVGKDVSSHNESSKKQTSELFLNDIDLSNGNFMLYIKHKEFGEFSVTDADILKKNKNALKVKVSFANYFPGEGDRSYGVMLFKDNKLIKQKNGGIFKIFEIGDLKQGAIAVKKHRLSDVKSKIQSKIDSLQSDRKAFITFQSELSKEDKEFHFRIYFPSIAVPVVRGKDDYGYERIKTVNGMDYKEWQRGNDNGFDKKWLSQIEKCIRDKAGETANFDMSISNGTLSGAYIFDVKEKWGGELKNADNQILFVKDFMYYTYEAYIGANQEDAKKLLAIDYTHCISESERNRPKVIAKMKALIKQSTKPYLSLEKGEVGLLGYRDSVNKSAKLYEQEYQLNWLEIE